jgi:hypothetical protein
MQVEGPEGLNALKPAQEEPRTRAARRRAQGVVPPVRLLSAGAASRTPARSRAGEGRPG